MKIKFAAFSLFLVSAAGAQTLPPGVEKRASVAGITEYGFANGLRVVLFPDASSPRITVNMTYLVGSRHEGYGESGMAHLLEHLNFIRTTDNRNIKEELVVPFHVAPRDTSSSLMLRLSVVRMKFKCSSKCAMPDSP